MIPSSPIAYRTLTWHGHGGTHDVTASIFAPTPVDDHFVCAVAIDGLPGPIRTNVTGIDSLQAIINAVVSVRGYLDTHADDLSFLDQPRQHGIPFIVPPLDADEERYIEQLVWSEIGHYLEISSAEHTRRASQ